MDLEELKLRQLAGLHLLAPADCRTVVRDLCGVQAQFLSNAVHAVDIRSPGFSPEGLVKSWTLRGTMHVFDQADLPLFLHRGRTHFLRPCDTLEADEFLSKERKGYFAALVTEAVTNGADTREDLRVLCRTHGMTEGEEESLFNAWGGLIRALCENGVLCHKVQEKKAYLPCPAFTPMEAEPARLALAQRYFTHFGPSTVRDAVYFFGTTQAQVKAWLKQLPVTAAECLGRTYYFIENGIGVPDAIPDCLFLAGFDQLLLGHEKKENLFLPPEHLRQIFSLAGIVMAPVLVHGKIVGRWKQKGKKWP